MNNRIGLVQETHWSEHETEVWRTTFPARTLVASPGYPGPAGGVAGGVCILLPSGVTLLEQEEIVQGCAIAAIVRLGEHGFR
eukprot:5934332-Pyramimonas_sp.AAC.1